MVDQKKNCKKGYNCGAACIEKADDCTIEISESTSAVIDKFVNMVKSQVSDKENKMGAKFLPEEAEALLARGEELSNDNIDGLKREVAKQGDFIKLVSGESTGSDMTEIESQAFAAAVVKALPAAMATKIGGNGSPGKYWAGKDENGDNIWKNPKEMKATDFRVRAVEVIKRYVKQGGIDAYTLNPKPFSLHDMDVEHVRPLADSAKGDLKANDSPDNWVLVRGGLNKLRSSHQLVDFAKQANTWKNMTPEQKAAKIAAAAMAKKGSAAIKKAEYNKLLGGDDVVMSGKALEAQTVHQLGAKSIGRMSRSTESTGRGASPAPSAVRKSLVGVAIKERSSRTGDVGNYKKDMSEDDFKSYYTSFMNGPDKVVAKERLAQHKAGDASEYLKQDSITKQFNSELFGPIRDARNTRMDNFKSKGMTYEEALEIERGEVRAHLTKIGATGIEEAVASLEGK